MNELSAFSSVVFPEPVPPEIRMFSRACTQPASSCEHLGRSCAPFAISCSTRESAPKRRMDSTGPSSASGGMIALTREPSGRRASTIGDDSSTRRPTRLTMRSITARRCALLRKLRVRRATACPSLDVDVLRAVDEDVADACDRGTAARSGRVP